MSPFLAGNIVLQTPPLENTFPKIPSRNIKGRKNVLKFWKPLIKVLPIKITNYEVMESGKKTQVLVEYGRIGVVALAEVEINQYGEIDSMIYSKVSEIPRAGVQAGRVTFWKIMYRYIFGRR